MPYSPECSHGRAAPVCCQNYLYTTDHITGSSHSNFLQYTDFPILDLVELLMRIYVSKIPFYNYLITIEMELKIMKKVILGSA